MNRLAFLFIFFIFNALIFTLPSYAALTVCPKEAIHCIYNVSKSDPKWIRVVMLPTHITMILCLANTSSIYLEKDDVEADQLPPGAHLTWYVSQCLHEDCVERRSLGADQFILLLDNDHYSANPPQYRFAFDPYYGDTCRFV